MTEERLFQELKKVTLELEAVKMQNDDLKATHNEMFHRFKTLANTFNELLDVHLEMRDRFGFGEFFQDYKTDWLEKSGLLDDFLLD